MNILAIDDERSALNILVRAISEAAPDANIMRFERTDVLLSTLQAGDFVPDVAFLDIEMPNMNKSRPQSPRFSHGVKGGK